MSIQSREVVIPLWVVGNWVLPFIVTVTITPVTIYLGSTLVWSLVVH